MFKAIKTAISDISALLNKVDDLEKRSRRNNIRLVGVPEKAEGRDPVVFFESWLATSIGKDSLSPFFAIERVHRVNHGRMNLLTSTLLPSCYMVYEWGALLLHYMSGLHIEREM